MRTDEIRKLQGARLTAARIAAGFRSARAAALELNWKESTYRAHETGGRTIGHDDAERYAKSFAKLGAKVDAAHILFGGEQPATIETEGDQHPQPFNSSENVVLVRANLVPATYAGIVEAGAYRPVDELNDFSGVEPLAVTRDRDFPFAKLVFFDVAGDSMNDLRPRPILAGDRLICIDYEASISRLPFRDGMVVVVEQVTGGGHLRERSVKQLEIHGDRHEFHPRSTSKKHKPIVVEKDAQADDGRMVRIVAIVRSVMNDVPLS